MSSLSNIAKATGKYASIFGTNVPANSLLFNMAYPIWDNRSSSRQLPSVNRSAFTLVELLVSLGVLSILLALMLPAIVSAREAARRMTCSNNLKQVGLSIHEYHTAHEMVPWTYCPLFKSLQYLDPNLYNALASRQYENTSTISVLFCPSDGFRESAWSYSYVMNAGTGIGKNDGIVRSQGDTPTRFSDITDGLSNTALMSEKLILSKEYIKGEQSKRTPWTATREFFAGEEDAFIAHARMLLSKNELLRGPDYGSHRLGWGYEEPYNHIAPPQFLLFRNVRNEWSLNSPTSLHEAGFQLLLADGSVRFVNNSISLAPWRNIGSRNGGDIVTLAP